MIESVGEREKKRLKDFFRFKVLNLLFAVVEFCVWWKSWRISVQR